MMNEIPTVVAGSAPEMPTAQPVVTSRGEHCISRRDIDPDALKVLYRLARNNYIAYLVGGGVRDLLLGRKPKDFDVSTNARPEQIRAIFRNCILIGRRFRLAHIRYGEKIIETSTFRSTPKAPANPDDPEADLFQRDDNMFGSPAEDAFRRDFTVNGLFYDIESFSIIDYVGGLDDLAARRIRCIGDPSIRFREDPVRMVRAIRFASRLNFTLDPDTEEAIRRHGEELTKASPARLLEEITRLFAFSSGERAVRLLASTGLLRVILPEVAAFLDSDKYDAEIFWRRLRALDTGDTVLPEATPALIFAVLFFDAFKADLQRDWTFDTTPKLRFDKAHDFLDPLSVRLRFPRKLVDRIVHMYINQSRFSGNGERGSKKGSLTNFVTQESFHESLALAEIVLSSEDGSQQKLNFWRDLLAERIFGQESGGAGVERISLFERGEHREQRDQRRQGRQDWSAEAAQHEHSASSAQTAQGEDEASAVSSVASSAHEEHDEELPGRKLSRSARRRRNKRLRRQQGNGNAPAAAVAAAEGSADSFADAPVEASAERPKTRGVVFGAEAAMETEAEEAAPKPDPRNRRGRGRRKESEEHRKPVESQPVAEAAVEAAIEPSPAPAVPEEKPAASANSATPANAAAPAKRGRGRNASRSAKPEAAPAQEPKPEPQHQPHPVIDAAPPKPLTAAAFWTEPEPEPSPEPKPEKKPRGGRKKPASPKSKTADKPSPAGSSAEPAPRKPLPMDKADEADIPIDWLDEI